MKMNRAGKSPTASAFAKVATAALVMAATCTVATGQSTPNTTLYADTGSINAPHSGVWVGNPYNSATPGRLWISDTTAGLCRLDPTNPAAQPAPTAPFALTTNVNGALPQEQDCFPAANAAASTVGQPDVLYAAGPNSAYVFAPISVGNIGVYRLTINLATQSITSVETLATAAQLGAVTSPDAVSMGADGKLYVGDTTNGIIVRITNPAAALGTQLVQSVATSPRGAGVLSLTLHNNDIYDADSLGGFLYRQPFADTCNGACTTTQLNMTSQAVVADRSVSTGNKYVYIDNSGIEVDAERVLQYDATVGTLTLYSPGIFDSTGAVTTQFASVAGLIVDPAGNLYVVDDGSAGAANSGRVFQIPAGSTPYSASAGLTPPPPVPVAPAAQKVSTSYASGVSTVNSTVWIDGALGGHLWVSDVTRGFCQLNGGVLVPATCFKPVVNGFVAGQAALGVTTDALGNDVFNVYVPDSGANSGIYRVAFDPATETLGASVNIGKGSSTPSAVAVGLEGSLYVGYKTSAQIDKFTTPVTRPTLVTRIAQTNSGSGVKSMAFLGNDLYLVETTQITVVLKASPALTRGAATPVGNPTTAHPAGGQKPTTTLQVTNPLSITTDNNDFLYIGSQGQVNMFQLSTQKQTLLSTSGGDGSIGFGKITAMGLDSSGGLYAADDGTASTSKGAAIWKVLP